MLKTKTERNQIKGTKSAKDGAGPKTENAAVLGNVRGVDQDNANVVGAALEIAAAVVIVETEVAVGRAMIKHVAPGEAVPVKLVVIEAAPKSAVIAVVIADTVIAPMKSGDLEASIDEEAWNESAVLR